MRATNGRPSRSGNSAFGDPILVDSPAASTIGAITLHRSPTGVTIRPCPRLISSSDVNDAASRWTCASRRPASHGRPSSSGYVRGAAAISGRHTHRLPGSRKPRRVHPPQLGRRRRRRPLRRRPRASRPSPDLESAMTPDTFQLLPPEEDDDDLEEDVPDEDDEEVEQDEGDDEDEETWQVGASSSRVPRSGFGVRV